MNRGTESCRYTAERLYGISLDLVGQERLVVLAEI